MVFFLIFQYNIFSNNYLAIFVNKNPFISNFGEDAKNE